MKFLIISKQDSQTDADNYGELEIKNFKSANRAIYHVRREYSKNTKLFKLTEIKMEAKDVSG